MNCPKCQQPVANDAAFCGACGARIGGAPPPDPSLGASPLGTTPAFATAGANVSGAAAAMPGFNSQATSGFIARLKGILLSPKTEWPLISREGTRPAVLFTSYVIPLAVIAALITFIRMSVLGISLPFSGGTLRTPVMAGLMNAVLSCVMALVGVGLIALIINVLAPTFGGTRDTRRALQAAAYSLTAAYLGTVFGLLPMGTLLGLLAGLYGIYTLYLGLPVMMSSKPDKAVGYTASVVVCTILVGLILGALSASLGIGRSAALGSFNRTSDRAAAQEQAAQSVGNVIGGMLGTDEKGKEGIGAAVSNLAKTGEQMEQQQKQAEASAASGASGASGAADVAPSQQNATRAMTAAGGLMSALGGALGGAHRHTPVDFHKLEALLPPSVAGMSRQQAGGEANQALGVQGTSATASYRSSGDARAEVHIADATGVSGLMDMADAMGVNGTTESESGYEKDGVLNGRKVHEKYDRNSKHGEVSTVVAKRFQVDVSGDDVSMADLEKTLSGIDLNALESMKDAGAQ